MKLTHLLPFILIVSFGKANAQENYSTSIQKAIKIIHEEDSTQYAHAFDLIENAFEIAPDSITASELYYASLLAARLKNTDKAFGYLTPLSRMNMEDAEFPGWSFILDESANNDYSNIIADKRWEILKKDAEIGKEKFFDNLLNTENEFYSISNIDLKLIRDPKDLYKAIRSYNPYLDKQNINYSISLHINDTTKTSYLVHLPQNYDARVQYPVLIFLHGAVRYCTLKEYQTPSIDLGGWNRFYTKYGDLNNIILVLPSANRQYNWITPDDGFFMVPTIVRQLKCAINVNDNKVFISGHSNGATGSFSYLMKQPSQFAGFYGFNTHPKVFTGGTFIENILNRSFINFSTDQDYYYPPNANNQLNELMQSIQADYKDYRYTGYPHWFPHFNESEPAYQILFKDIKERERNPFPKYISWEFDDDKYGNIDWLCNIKLDTLNARANWHNELNFKIHHWLRYDKNNELVTEKVDVDAFDFPRKSGKIIAEFDANIFQIKTSCIRSFTIHISPKMVDLNKNVKVYINGKLYFNNRIKYNRGFTLENFNENRDREQVWVNYIELKL